MASDPRNTFGCPANPPDDYKKSSGFDPHAPHSCRQGQDCINTIQRHVIKPFAQREYQCPFAPPFSLGLATAPQCQIMERNLNACGLSIPPSLLGLTP